MTERFTLEIIESVEVVTILEEFGPGEGLESYKSLAQRLRGPLRLFDFSVGWNPSTEELKALAAFAADLQSRSPVRIAIVVAGDLGYGLGRMYQAIREMRDLDNPLMIFRSRQEAMDWLTGAV